VAEIAYVAAVLTYTSNKAQEFQSKTMQFEQEDAIFYQNDEQDVDSAGEGDIEQEVEVNEMPEPIVKAFIRRMGSGGGMNAIAECKNAQEKKRFWITIFEELQELGRIGAKSPAALVTKWNYLCGKFKKSRLVANKSGSGKAKFKYYDVMMEEVGLKPKFTCKSVINSRASTIIQEAEPPVKKLKADSSPDDIVDIDDDSNSSDDDKRNRHSRKSMQAKILEENRKHRKYMRKSAEARDNKSEEFMRNLLGQGQVMADAAVCSVANQDAFNTRFFDFIEKQFAAPK
jgi:hypothetical protein